MRKGVTAEGQAPGDTRPSRMGSTAWLGRGGWRRGRGGRQDPRASFPEMTHLTGQGTPGRRGRPSSPTVAHCSLSGEAWQPRSPQTGGLPPSVGHTFPGHTLPPSQGFVQAPGSDHKKCPFLWRAHLRREVPASQTAGEKDIPSTFLTSQRVRGWRPQTARPPRSLGPSRIVGFFRVLLADLKQVRETCHGSSVLQHPPQYLCQNAKKINNNNNNGNTLPTEWGETGLHPNTLMRFSGAPPQRRDTGTLFKTF